MRIGKIKKIHKDVPTTIPVILPKPKPKPIPAPDIFQPGKQPVKNNKEQQ